MEKSALENTAEKLSSSIEKEENLLFTIKNRISSITKRYILVIKKT